MMFLHNLNHGLTKVGKSKLTHLSVNTTMVYNFIYQRNLTHFKMVKLYIKSRGILINIVMFITMLYGFYKFKYLRFFFYLYLVFQNIVLDHYMFWLKSIDSFSDVTTPVIVVGTHAENMSAQVSFKEVS